MAAGRDHCETASDDAGPSVGGGRRLTLAFEEATRFLFPRTVAGKPWSLDATGRLLASLGNPHREFPAIHIGGTNGKGSVATLVYAALRASGWSTGLYTSPHLVDVRERFVVDDRAIGHAAFAAWTHELRPLIEQTDASFFEATTAIAFADFAARQVDIAVVEVGLGGRLDATNVVHPVVSAVTNIAREHTEYLGTSLEAIAREKAGIAKAGVPFVVGEPDDAVAGVLVQVGREAGARVSRVPSDARYGGALLLSGGHQARNAAVAEAVLGCLPAGLRPRPDAVVRGFGRARLPGRFDRRGRWLFDVAHNPAGIDVLVNALRAAAPPPPLHALVSVLADKAWSEMLRVLGDVADRVWLTIAPSAPPERRWDLAEVAAVIRAGTRGGEKRIVIEPDFDRALGAVQRDAGTILVTGSFHTVGDTLARLPGFAPLG